MKKIEWTKTGNMRIETGHKAFDQQTNLITTGNIISTTQEASYVRGELDVVSPWDYTVHARSEFRDYDLDAWSDLPAHVKAYIRERTNDTKESVWVSEFFHYLVRHVQGGLYPHINKVRIVDGYVITTHDHQLLRTYVTGPTYKSAWVIDGVLPYIAEGHR